MSNYKQSSVEWYSVKRDVLEIEVRLGKLSANEYEEELAKAEQQAKAMHREEIMDSRTNGRWVCTEKYGEIRTNIQYYNETFEDKK